MATVKDITRQEGTKFSGNRMVKTQEIHCAGCGRFLGYHAIIWGMIKVKCPACKEWNVIDIRPDVG